MKIERANKPPIIIGNRVPLGLAIGSAVTWAFWVGGEFWWQDVDVPTAMVTQFSHIVVFFAQIWWVQKYGVTT